MGFGTRVLLEGLYGNIVLRVHDKKGVAKRVSD